MYNNKYLKYKKKYLNLSSLGGSLLTTEKINNFIKYLKKEYLIEDIGLESIIRSNLISDDSTFGKLTSSKNYSSDSRFDNNINNLISSYLPLSNETILNHIINIIKDYNINIYYIINIKLNLKKCYDEMLNDLLTHIEQDNEFDINDSSDYSDHLISNYFFYYKDIIIEFINLINNIIIDENPINNNNKGYYFELLCNMFIKFKINKKSELIEILYFIFLIKSTQSNDLFLQFDQQTKDNIFKILKFMENSF